MSAFYRFQDGFYHPLGPARTPDGHQKGRAVSGLLSREIERTPTLAPLRFARITIELQLDVPMQPTTLRARVIRDGKRQQLVGVELLVAGAVVASAHGLLVREGEGPIAPELPRAPSTPETALHVPVSRTFGEPLPKKTQAIRNARSWPGSITYWTRFDADLVAGEATSAAVRAIMACDIGGALLNGGDRQWACRNFDSSIYFARIPDGDQILTDTEAEQYGDGFGLVSSVLSDNTGVFGYAHQTLLYSKGSV